MYITNEAQALVIDKNINSINFVVEKLKNIEELEKFCVIDKVYSFDSATNELINFSLLVSEFSDVAIEFPLEVIYSEQRKKFIFFIQFKKYGNISYNDYDSALEKFEKPSEIGVLSIKKLDVWVDYLQNVDQSLRVISNERKIKLNKFYSDIEGLDVVWNNTKTRGYVKSNLFELSFEITSGIAYVKPLLIKPTDVVTTFKELLSNGF